MNNADIKTIKNDIRRNLLSVRSRIPEEKRTAASEVICRKIRETEEYRRAKNILLYRAVRSEVNLQLLAEFAELDGKTAAWPLCTGQGIMEARVPDGPDAFVLGAYHIPEPDPKCSRLLLPSEIDLVICPCAGVTRSGIRIGMGAGYYHRFLPQCTNAVIFCAAYALQVIECFPQDPWDYPVDQVFSEI